MARIPNFHIPKENFQWAWVVPIEGLNAQCHSEIWRCLIGLHKKSPPFEIHFILHRNCHHELVANTNTGLRKGIIEQENKEEEKERERLHEWKQHQVFLFHFWEQCLIVLGGGFGMWRCVEARIDESKWRKR